ncbi:MAG TPA: 3-hydroxyacyl-CoA dehydrogenase NAD-binding domain-containing protein [Amaricoccus sp.]|uniref:3-hydroxyacyl-CoA dehydrogenase NAD-binding domain-containing protein n=1 Tax=Amaricoccus sp. TaxID=1872485 RepID=UPI002D0EA640|nr:3-hydroxyacyl-CoA dehydrogenase NAD-binding domain-containing protein [Amaricoccus sp.]HMQ93513.1 3-hydroxyacyl-CoA dehydrogenase NAD-binding domain-containing protein [Amaricoccus sp.]HMR54425.1 3-hydroxyacyl-CoA dehydrogenase NAD-binding domain-containing protein [Amaricoccus sp.]HMR61557.1 3-hydroxyacyl-CoA dehydrogenase NAD-binding domain-containing protein [Amaricoccus sp.]HMU00504.1 3-hydroxyacyl-CoA dehydrogenase NAD-binding domain-containing protein [Amaricoccus sp.]
MTIFSSETDADGIATITWDLPDRSMNVLTEEGIAELEAAFDAALADPAVRGIVLTSGKADFAGGMDLGLLATMKTRAGDDPARGLFEGTMAMHRLLRRIERAGMDPKTHKGGRPVAWASPGISAGIGTEIGLACHRRFLADDPRARVGLPEILVGLFPGAGGTTRLTRMVGVMAAAPILLEGRMLDARAAKSAGLIDEVVPARDLIQNAKDWVLAAQAPDLVKPWDAKGYRMPGGAPYHPAGFMTFVGASAMVHGRTQGVYPAARAMLSAIYEGALVPFDTALTIEARWFTSVLMNPSSEAMIRSLFLNKQALEKGALRPAAPDQKVAKLGVIGAGMMGAGIAHVAALAGIEVVLVDRDQEAADRGRAHAEGLLDEAVKRKKTTPEQREAVLARITATPDYAALAGCDLAIEAVFEDPAVKAEATARAEAHLPEDAIFATNTSTLPIGELARASRDPANFIGIHFFSPVHKMALVEIIRGNGTGDRAVAKALDFVRQIRKTPIVVNDARFFYANRCIIPYINEGVRMLAEGVEPALIENAARQLGFPLGPLQLVDETSIDLGVKIAKATRAAMGDAYPESPADGVLFKLAELGRLGRKAGAGFYAYDEKGKREGLWSALRDLWPPRADQPALAEVQHRLAMIQTLEAVRALVQGVLTDIREGDVGAILGWGFMPWSGGPFSWLDLLGAARAVEICDGLAAGQGSRFEPPALLREMAASGETFYGRFRPAEAA